MLLSVPWTKTCGERIAMDIKIDREIKIPVYLQIASSIKQQIMTGSVNSDTILPSERALAKMLSIHRNTVARAYGELKGQGLIESYQGIGYRVCASAASEEGMTKNCIAQTGFADARKEHRRGDKRVNWLDQIKDEYLDMTVTFDEMFQRFSRPEKISLGSGIAATGIYDREKLSKRISKIVSEEGKKQYFYTPYQGDEDLRRQIVSYLSTKGIKATTRQIQILTETNQALDFLITLLVKPGDAVITEEPVSPDTYRAIGLAGGKLITVPMGEDGIETAYLEEIIQRQKPRLICLNSSFHDPTGQVLSVEKRKEILKLSEKYRLPVIEYDEASELHYDIPSISPMKVFDRLENVVYIYSFSLTFVPGLSLAFIVANADLIRRLSYLVSVRLVAMDWMTQRLLAEFLEEGVYYRKLSDYRKEYKKKRDIVCGKLEEMKELGVSYLKPKGGIYVWCRLPDGVDSKELDSRAYSSGISILPGYVFYPSKNGGREYIRINFSYETPERLSKGMDILKASIEECMKG